MKTSSSIKSGKMVILDKTNFRLCIVAHLERNKRGLYGWALGCQPLQSPWGPGERKGFFCQLQRSRRNPQAFLLWRWKGGLLRGSKFHWVNGVCQRRISRTKRDSYRGALTDLA